jgi:hypothetical protein
LRHRVEQFAPLEVCDPPGLAQRLERPESPVPLQRVHQTDGFSFGEPWNDGPEAFMEEVGLADSAHDAR